VALLGFVGDVGDLDFEELYPLEVLERLQGVLPCDDLTYQDCNLPDRRFTSLVGLAPDLDGDDELYWSVGPCPISDFRVRTGDLAAVTISEVVGRRRYHDLPIFQDYFRPEGLDDVLDLGLSAAPQRQRSFVFFRASGAPNFSARDRTVLALLRPHLCRVERQAALRRQLSQALCTLREDTDTDTDPYRELTPREREIVELVAEGKTNGQIAAELWVAPSTVKKHLENVYAKLGVGRRTAAATLMRAQR